MEPLVEKSVNVRVPKIFRVFSIYAIFSKVHLNWYRKVGILFKTELNTNEVVDNLSSHLNLAEDK